MGFQSSGLGIYSAVFCIDIMANLALGWSNEKWRLQLDVLNLFDSDDHDVDYFYAPRLPGETAEGVEGVHYRVFEPRQVSVYLGYTF